MLKMSIILFTTYLQGSASIQPRTSPKYKYKISMIFVSLISAYIVKKGEPGGFNVDLPSMFYYSTIVVILSSIFKQLSYFSTKKDDFKTQKLYLLGSFVTGALFLLFQYYGWVQLVEGGVFFVGHPDGSFIYILSGVHAFHLISGPVSYTHLTLPTKA